MKSILMPIQPYWVFLIIAQKMGWDVPQEKTVEVRKNCPKDKDWNKVIHIYCTKNKKSFNKIPRIYQTLMKEFLGKVVGEFVCDNIEEFTVGSLHSEDIEKLACLSFSEIINYFYKPNELDGETVKFGYAWHISDLKIYDKPKELEKFFVKGVCENYDHCCICRYFYKGRGWLDGNYYDKDNCDIEWGIKPITRAQQNWCYVMDEEKEINNIENQNPYEGIDEKIVEFVKAIEFYEDYDHTLCTGKCEECKFHPLCEYRGEINVNLALHLLDAGYGNVKQAVREFAEKLKLKLKLGAYDWQYAKVDSKTIDDLIEELYGEE